jgi:serine/threonine protein kinase
MSSPPIEGPLGTNDWNQLQSWVGRFEAAWAGSETVDLAAYLPPPGHPLRFQVLQEAIKTDLEMHWKRGQTIGIENYLQRFPELRANPQIIPQLLCEEYRVRQQYGDRPGLASYQPRFPAQFAEFQRLVEVWTRRVATMTGAPPELQATAAGTLAAPQKVPSLSTQATFLGNQWPPGYKPIKRLGRGSFGEVWRAEAPGGFPVAMKIILRPLDDEEAQREKRALELTKQLRHAYLLQTHAYWELGDQLYIAMELADGNLRDRLNECRAAGMNGIPPDELLRYFEEAAAALDLVHSYGVWHRDIKPDNLLLIKPGPRHKNAPTSTILGAYVKIADFGLARSWQSVSINGAGTPAYMAPEVWRNKTSRTSDQYSLAATYCELRLGRTLYASKDMYSLMNDHIEQKPDLRPLEEAEQAVLLRALSKNPDERYESCRAFVKALTEAVSAPRKPVVSPPEPVSQPDGSGPTSEPTLETIRHTLTPSEAEKSPERYTPRWKKDTGPLPSLKSEPRLPRRRRFWTLLLLLLSCGSLGFLAWYLRVEEPPLPPPEVPIFWPDGQGWEKVADAKLVTDEANKFRYYEEIDVVKDGQRVRFLLIAKKTGDPNGIPTFYIMKNKVSVELFRLFATKLPKEVKSSAWKNEDHKLVNYPKDKQPVLRVRVEDAYRFAKWLGGDLPSVHQWDTAAGRYDPKEPWDEGPYKGHWDELKNDHKNIAVGRKDKGPMNCGEAKDDNSRFGCRDMAGNGWEWTRNFDDDPVRRVPISKATGDDWVVARGRTYFADAPLRFQDLKGKSPVVFDYFNLNPEADIGFRVVIELPPAPRP